MTHRLQQLTDALQKFLARMAIAPSEVEGHETPQRIRFSKILKAGPSRTLNQVDLQPLLDVLGPALNMSWRVGEYPVASVSGESSRVDLAELKTETRDDTEIEFVLEIDKSLLLSTCGFANQSRRHHVLFLFSGAFERTLRLALADPSVLESSIWPNAPTQAVVLIADCSVMITGKLLVILGATELAARNTIPTVTEEHLHQEAAIHMACRDAIRWESPWTSFLTPEFLNISVDPESKETQFVKVLACVGANLAVLFTADRVRKSGSGVLATFIDGSSQFDLRLFAASDEFVDVVPADARAMVRLSVWACEERWRADKIRLVQISVVRVMSRLIGSNSCSQLIAMISGLEAEVKWHWKTFISEAVSKYVEEEAELENEISETVDGYESQVASMISSVSATVLAAIGVLIGSFIAAAFNPKFNATVFAVGIRAYAVYVLMFPGIYSMSHHWLRYKTTGQIFEKRKGRFVRLLGSEAANRIVGDDVVRAQVRFGRWFGITILALTLVILAATVLSFIDPDAFIGKHASGESQPAIRWNGNLISHHENDAGVVG